MSTTTLPGVMPAKASISAGLRFSSRAVSAAGRPASATAAFICAVGAAAIAIVEIRMALLARRKNFFIVPLSPKGCCRKLALLDCASGRDLDGIARLLLGGMDHQRALHAGDVLLRRHRVGDEALERRKILGHAFEDEIHLTRQHVALPHFSPTAGAFLEMLEIGVLLAGQTDKDEAG